jgi:hypothetical protein
MRFSVAGAALLLILSFPSARALSGSADNVTDPAALAEMESRAEHAQAREQCFLYTELVHDYVLVAGKQIADGDMEQATATLKRVETLADRIHLDRDTKKLKNAETLMHMATYRLTQFMHQVSSDDVAVLQSVLKRLDKLHDQLLAEVFAH